MSTSMTLAGLHNVNLSQIDLDSLEDMDMDFDTHVGVRKFREERYEPKRQAKQATLSTKQARAAKRADGSECEEF